MKRFLVFIGYDYEALGGGDDLHSSHDSLEEAMEAFKKCHSGRWAHIFDMEEERITARLYNDGWEKE